MFQIAWDWFDDLDLWWMYLTIAGDTQSSETPIEPIPEYTAAEELQDEKNWRAVNIGDKQYKIDMKVIEPYKKVLSHGGKS